MKSIQVGSIIRGEGKTGRVNLINFELCFVRLNLLDKPTHCWSWTFEQIDRFSK
jgi:hypothetical protein